MQILKHIADYIALETRHRGSFISAASNESLYTVRLTTPNVVIDISPDNITVLCWIYGEGVTPRQINLEYGDPNMIQTLHQHLQQWETQTP